jgi:hypothetical protein
MGVVERCSEVSNMKAILLILSYDHIRDCLYATIPYSSLTDSVNERWKHSYVFTFSNKYFVQESLKARPEEVDVDEEPH